MNKINVIIKDTQDETLGFDFSSLLSNPAVGIGMNAILPGSSFALPLINQAITTPKKPSTGSQLTQSFLNSMVKKPSVVAPPPKQNIQAKGSSAPPPPTSKVQAFVESRTVQPTAVAKQGIDKNILIIGGIALAGFGVYILSNNKGKRR